MQKEPMRIARETVLPEVKRRNRKVPESEHGIANISYLNLFELYLRECKKKNLAEETIQGYRHSTRYFLDFAGHDLMCHDVTQDLINEYYLYLQEYHKATTVNSYVFKVSPTVLYGVDKAFTAQLTKINPMIEVLEPYINARKKVLCRCGYCKNEWYGTPDKLLQGNGCPNCDKRNKTSFPEQAIYFYLRKIYPDALNRYCLPNSKTEIDKFIPSLNIGIEYDGVYWHKSKVEREVQKYQKCQEYGITLYRMRESSNVIDGIADAIIIRHKPYNFVTLDSALVKLFGVLGVKILVNTLEDSASIREQYYTELAQNSLAALYPEVAKEWHTEKNGAITPNMVSYGSNVQYWWRCSTCSREWFAAVADRTTGGKGCSQCAIVKLSKIFKKKHEAFIEQLKEVNPNLEPLEKP